MSLLRLALPVIAAAVFLFSCGHQTADEDPLGWNPDQLSSSWIPLSLSAFSSGSSARLSSSASLSSGGISSASSGNSSGNHSSEASSSGTTISSSGTAVSSAASSSSNSLTDPQWALSPYHDRFIWIPGGTFTRADSTRVEVHGFYAMTVEVSRDFYKAVMGTDPSLNTSVSEGPVERVSWYQAALFCNKISNQLGFDTAYVYTGRTAQDVLLNLSVRLHVRSARLPTEAEWEYAARAGAAGDYFWPPEIPLSDVNRVGLYTNPYIASAPNGIRVHEPNAFGLYETLGNVWEWTNDWYAPLSATTLLKNPTGPSNGSLRSVRGGGFDTPLESRTLSARQGLAPEDSRPNVGFRVVIAPALPVGTP